MKVAYITKYFRSGTEDKIMGTLNYTKSFCDEMNKHIDLHVVYHDFTGSSEKVKNFHPVRGYTIKMAWDKNIVLPPFPLLAKKEAKKIDADIQHMVTSINDPWILPLYLRMFSNFKNTIFQPMVNLDSPPKFSMAPNIIATSKYLQEYFPDSIFIPAGIDIEKIQKVKKMDLSMEGTKILFVGQFVPKKQPLLLVEVARRLPEYNFIWAGKGELEKKIKDAIIKYNIKGTIFGHVDVPSLMKAVDVVVLPFRRDLKILATPLTVLEAMACGTPIVITNSKPLLEVANHNNAFISDSLESMVCDIENALDDKTKVKQAQKDAKKYGIKEIVKKTLSFYEEII